MFSNVGFNMKYCDSNCFLDKIFYLMFGVRIWFVFDLIGEEIGFEFYYKIFYILVFVLMMGIFGVFVN